MLKAILSSILLFSAFNLYSEEAPKTEANKTPVLQEQGSRFAGISLGASRPEGGVPARLHVEIEGIMALNQQLAVGAFINRSNGPIVNDSPVDISFMRIGAEAIFNPTYDSFLDLRGGLGFIKASAKIGDVSISSDTSTPFFVGLGGGITFPIMDKLILVPALHYSRFFENSDTKEINIFDATLGLRMNF